MTALRLFVFVLTLFTWQQAFGQAAFSGVTFSPSSGSADSSGRMTVTVTGTVYATEYRDAVSSVSVMNGAVREGGQDYFVDYDPNIEGHVNATRVIRTSVALPPGTHTLRLVAGTALGFQASSQTFVVTVAGKPTNGATFVSQSVPSTMYAGQTYSVSVTFRNTGTSTWTAAAAHRIGAQNPGDNLNWGVGRVDVPSSVAPGSTATFNFTVRAPSAAGTYNFQWGMLQEAVEWFGGLSTNVPVAVTVAPPVNNAAFVSQSVPSTMTAGQRYNVSVTMKNTGTTTWSPVGTKAHNLGPQNPRDSQAWGVGRVLVPSNIAPGANVTFNFQVTAPSTAGTYNFQWGMLQEAVEWFGGLSSNVAVRVDAGAPPTVTITNPTTDTTLTTSSATGQLVSLTGTAAATSGATITRLEFFDGATSLGATASTSTSIGKTLALGEHRIELRATDSRGQTASAYRTIRILAPAPTASLTAPANGASYTIASGTTYSVNVIGSGVVAANARLAKIEVLDAGVPIHTQTSGASINVLLPLAAGTHSLQLRVTDHLNTTATSTAAVVVVKAPVPVVTLSAPRNEFVATTSGSTANVGVQGSATAQGGTRLTRLELLDNDVVIDSTTSASLNVTKALALGTHKLQLRATDSAGQIGISSVANITVAQLVAGDGAVFVSQTVPAVLATGQPATFTVTMMNTGTTTWTHGTGYRLGAQNPQDTRTWGGRAYLSGNVAPGGQGTFTFTTTAPFDTGTYNFQWQMVREYVGWFGPKTPNAQVLVNVGSGPTAVLSATPTNVRVSGTQTTAVSFTGSALRSGGIVSKLELFQAGNAGYGATPVKTVTGSAATLSLGTTSLNLGAGIHTFKLRGTDSAGFQNESRPIYVNVTNSALLGTISGVRINAAGAPELFGWTCQAGNATPLGYRVLVDAPSLEAGGIPIISGVANVNTEADTANIQSQCATPGTGHHFVANLGEHAAQYAGRRLYVWAETANAASTVSLPCGDNACTMPGAIRIGLTSPTANAVFVSPQPAFLKLRVTNYTGTLDQVGFMVDGQWVAAQADGATGEYSAQRTGLAVSTLPHSVYALVRQGNVTLQSVAVPFFISNGTSVALTAPAAGASMTVGVSQLLSATAPGQVQSVKFFVNGNLVASGVNSGSAWTANWTPTAAGSITLVARSYDGAGAQLAESPAVVATVVAGNGTGGTLLPVTITPPHLGDADAGTLPGALAVSRDGNATYSMELVVPPGTAGMQPRLSLDYAGNGPNSQLGLGWNLGGMSSIQRCGKTIAQDGVNGRIGFDKADRLCLDGQRLVMVNLPQNDDNYWANTAEYRTEIESFTRVTTVVANGRRSFRVETKDGRIMLYGAASGYATPVLGTPNSGARPVPPRVKDGARVWALDSVTDRSGNFIRYAYELDTTSGEHRLATIRYGGNGRNAHAAVVFSYAGRNDAWTRYLDETRTDVRVRLASIKSYVGSNLNDSVAGATWAREYTLGYEYSPTSGRSLLNSVTACARNPASGAAECLPATTFAWGKPDGSKTPGFKSMGNWNGPRLTTNNPAEQASANHPEYFAFADFENHGLTDVLEKRVAPPMPSDLGSWPQITRDSGNPLQPGTLRNSYRYFHNTGNGFVEYSYNISVDNANVNFAVLDIGDFNGDGAPDLLVSTQAAGARICLSPLSRPAGLPASGMITFTCTNQPAVGSNRDDDLPTVIDVNGSGRAAHYGSYSNGRARLCLETGCIDDNQPPLHLVQGPRALQDIEQPLRDYVSFADMADFTGIGRPSDVRWTQSYLYHFVDTDGSESTFHEWRNPDAEVVVTDLGAPSSPTARGFTVYVHPGNPPPCTTLECRPYWFDAPMSGGASSADFNGSGYSGVMYGYIGADSSGYKFKAPEMTLCLSTGRALDCRVRQKFSGNNYLAVLGVGDFVGDGAPAVLASTVTFNGRGDPLRTGALQVCRVTGDDTTGGTSANDGNMQCSPWGGLTYPVNQPAPTIARDQVLFADLLGTGRTQLLYYHAGSFVNRTWQEDGRWEIFAPVDMARDGEALDRIVRVTNGLGATSSVQYVDSLVTGIVSQSASNALGYPAKVGRMPAKLVNRIVTDNGVAGIRSASYRYGDPALDQSGRGALGFATVTMQDEQNGLSTVTEYAQTWPFVGMMKSQIVRTNGGIALQEVRQDLLEQRISHAGGFVTTSFPYVRTTTAQKRDPGGQDLGTTVTLDTYGDGWGNLTERAVTTTGASAPGKTYVTKAVTTYRNDLSTWLAGLPTLLRETRTDPDTGTLTRTVQKGFNTTTGLLETEVVEPNSTALMRTVTYGRTGNAFGLVSTSTESWTDPYSGAAQSRQTATTYDSEGRYPATVTNAAGHTETHTYDPATGARVALTSPNRLTTSWTVDGFGRVSRQINADLTETRRYLKRCTSGCPVGAAVADVTDHFRGADRIASPQVVYSDTAGRVVQTRTWGFNGAAILADQTYDSTGRPYEQYWPRFDGAAAILQWRHRYDVLDRPVSVESLGETGAVRSSTTVYTGMTTTSTNEKNQRRIEQRNPIGQVSTATDNLGNVTRFKYEPFGNLSEATDPMGNVTKVEYDLLGRRTDLRDPNLGWMHYDVDPLGRVWKTTSPNQRALGTSTRVVFDKLDRMADRFESDLESHWVFDTAGNGIGQLAEAYTGKPAQPDYRRLHAYDQYGRPGATTQLINGDTFVATPVLDAWGRVGQQKYRRNGDAEKVFDFRYNQSGHLAHIERAGLALWSVTEQDSMQRVTRATLGNGLQQTRSFNAYTGLPKGATLDSGGSRRLEESYGFDALGNVSQRTQYWEAQGFMESFTYDGLNRIETAQVDGRALQRFTYDAAGNIKTKSNVSSQEYIYPAATQPRPNGVTSIGGVGSFGYDNNGNQTSAPGRTTTWTSYDMPLRMTKGSVDQRYVYGPEHQRVRMDRADNGTAIVYAGSQEVELASGQAAVVRTYWPMGIGMEADKPGSATELVWVHTDRLGSVIGYSDAAGNLKERLGYDAWGKRRTTDGSATPDSLDGQVDHRGFTGHEMLDQLDLVHMNGRVYDPLIGRFLSADPLVQEPMNGQSYNRYTYVFNNPTNLTDPTGFASDPQKPPPPHPRVDLNCSSQIEKLRCAQAQKTWQGIVDSLGAGGAQATVQGGQKENKNPGAAGQVASASTITRTFTERIETGTALNGDMVIRHTGSWKEEDSRRYGTPGEIMGQWFGFNPVEHIARDMGASERQAYWIGFGGMLVSNPKQLLAQGAQKATFGQIRKMLASAQAPYKGSTVVGHALSKHAGRNPDIWGTVTGSMKTWNNQAMKHVRDIGRAPGEFEEVTTNGIRFMEKRMDDGRGMRLNMDGTFKGFID